MYLRPGSERLARARLTASYRVYRSWLRSISACTVTSYRIEHVQATALGPHSCRLELNISSKSRPGLFYPTFRRSDSKKVIVGMDFEDLSDSVGRCLKNAERLLPINSITIITIIVSNCCEYKKNTSSNNVQIISCFWPKK